MAKKKNVNEEWGPYFETYIKVDHEGNEYEQEVPVYMEVNTPHGIVGVPPKTKLTFRTEDDGEKLKIIPVYTPVASAKARKPKKITPDAPADKE